MFHRIFYSFLKASCAFVLLFLATVHGLERPLPAKVEIEDLGSLFDWGFPCRYALKAEEKVIGYIQGKMQDGVPHYLLEEKDKSVVATATVILNDHDPKQTLFAIRNRQGALLGVVEVDFTYTVLAPTFRLTGPKEELFLTGQWNLLKGVVTFFAADTSIKVAKLKTSFIPGSNWNLKIYPELNIGSDLLLLTAIIQADLDRWMFFQRGADL